MTLAEFWTYHMADGHYAVWKSGQTLVGDKICYGFSGAVVEFDNTLGFKGAPDWMDESDETEINIKLLVELPSAEDIHSWNC